MIETNGIKGFGIFSGSAFDDGKHSEPFDMYKDYHNLAPKQKILDYLKSLTPSAYAPMPSREIFTGEALRNPGVIDDGPFRFPNDFVHYYEHYDIGIPPEYEEYIANKLAK